MSIQFSGVGIMRGKGQQASIEQLTDMERQVGGSASLCFSEEKHGVDTTVWVSDKDLVKVLQDVYDGADFPAELTSATAEELRTDKMLDRIGDLAVQIDLDKLFNRMLTYATECETQGKDVKGKPVHVVDLNG